MLDLLEHAQREGWSFLDACRVLEITPLRVYRWAERRERGQLTDRAPGGGAVHGLLAAEAKQIVALFHEWGEVDRSHRKLAHRGSYLGRVWVSPSSVHRVLEAHGLRVRARPRLGVSAEAHIGLHGANRARSPGRVSGGVHRCSATHSFRGRVPGAEGTPRRAIWNWM